MRILQPQPASHEYTIKAYIRDSFGTRLLKLGSLSLLTLIAGGLILILSALNALLVPKLKGSGFVDWNAVATKSVQAELRQTQANRFYIGEAWSIQAWLAIVGTGFGLVSHGFHEADVHLFDWWCSRQARHRRGLNYARYRNTQPRAPVSYGIRGFPLFASLRYLVLITTVAVSIGYKFGITETAVVWHETLDPTIPFIKVRNTTGPYYSITTTSSADVTIAHWFGGEDSAFTDEYQTVGDDSYDH